MISPLTIGLAFGFLICIRSFWVSWALEDYQMRSLTYLTLCRLDEEAGSDMGELWPRSYMYWELWRWDFRRYVIDHERYDLMVEWLDTQLARTDLSHDVLQREIAAVERADLEERMAAVASAEPPTTP